MNNLKIKPVIFLIFSSLLLSCSSVTKKYLNSRDVASEARANNCQEALGDFELEDSSTSPVERNKTKRLGILKKQASNNDFEGFFNTLKNSYDNKSITKDDLPYGFSTTRESITKTFMSWNNNDHIPAFYQHYDESGEDTYGVVTLVSRKEFDPAQEEQVEAFKDVNRWVKEYENHFDLVYKKVREGFQAKLQLEELQKYNFSRSHFSRYKSEVIPLPYIIEENGSYVVKYVDKPFNTYSSFDTYLKDRELDAEQIFSQGTLDEMFRKSEIYNEIIDQAYRMRRLEFVRDSLDEIPEEFRNEEQIKLLATLNDYLFNRPDLLPRSDAIKWVQEVERNREIRAALTFKSSSRNSREKFKYNSVNEFVQSRTREVIGNARTWILGYGTAIGIGSIVTTLLLPYTEDPENNKVLAYLKNGIQNTLFYISGVSMSLVSCSDATRPWTVENVCYDEMLFSHLSYFYYKSASDPSYDFTKDPEFLKRRAELTEAFLARRDKHGRGEFFRKNDNYLKETAYRLHVDTVLLELIDEQYKNQPHLRDQVENLFIAAFDDRDKEKTKALLEDLKNKTDDSLVDSLKDYIDNEDKVIKRMTNYGTTPRENDIKKFTHKLKTIID